MLSETNFLKSAILLWPIDRNVADYPGFGKNRPLCFGRLAEIRLKNGRMPKIGNQLLPNFKSALPINAKNAENLKRPT